MRLWVNIIKYIFRKNREIVSQSLDKSKNLCYNTIED